jgi:DNA replication protein DnaC
MNPYSEIQKTFEIQNGVKMYNFEKCLGALHILGNYHFGNRFKIYEEDLPVIRKLVIYAIRDTATMIQLDISPDKALLLSGPVGCGKTSMMFLLNYFCPPQSSYKIKPCREVAFEFAKKGYEALVPYTQKEHKQIKLSTYCFDDLGTEKQIKHFGNECNVMAEIILSRYDSFIHEKSLTHVTTNLSASELEAYYGDRVRSRMRQMFNLIAFDVHSKDKR